MRNRPLLTDFIMWSFGLACVSALAATHWEGSYAKVTISDKLYVEGHANQRSCTIPCRLTGSTTGGEK